MWHEVRRGIWGIIITVVVAAAAAVPPVAADGCSGAEAQQQVAAGDTHLAAGRYREAISAFNRAILAAPDCDRAKQGVIEANRALLQQRGGADDTRAVITRHINLGGAAFDAGDYGRAIAEWEAALALDPENRVAAALIASAREAQVDRLIEEGSRLFAQGNTSGAVETWEEAKSIAPGNQTVLDLLDEGRHQLYREEETQLDVDMDDSMRRIRTQLERSRMLPLPDMDGAGLRYRDLSERPVESLQPGDGVRGAIMTELRNPVSLDFEDTDLRAVLRFLSEVTGINFLVQEEVFEELGEVDPDDEDAEKQIKVTIFVNELPLESALKGMLRQHGLDFSVERDFLYISTPDVLRASSFEQLEIRYYRLRDSARISLPKLVASPAELEDAGGENVEVANVAEGQLIEALDEIEPEEVGDSPVSALNYSVPRLLSLIRNFVPEVVEAVSQAGQQGNVARARQADTIVGGWQRIRTTSTFVEAEHVTRERKWDSSGREIISRVEYDPQTHTIIAKNTPSNLAMIERMLEHLDKPSQQVVIESRFLEVGLQDIQRVDTDLSVLGLTSSALGGRSLLGAGLASASGGGTSLATGLGGLDLGGLFTDGIFGGGNGKSLRLRYDGGEEEVVQATVNLLTQLDNTEVVSAPRVTTLSGKPAVIQDIRTQTLLTDITITTTVVQPPPGSSAAPVVVPTVDPTFTAVATGVTMTVTPLVLDDGTIRLVLLPDVSNLGDGSVFPFPVQGVDTAGNPTTDFVNIDLVEVFRQSLYTNVTVSDGDTLVLGGLVNNEVQFQERSVPFFRDIPFLGNFFRSTGELVSRKQLLIFIKSNIISPNGLSYVRLK